MIRAVPFHPEHLKLIEPSDVFQKEVGLYNFHQSYVDNPRAYAQTIMHDNTILGCLGGIVLWEGVAEVWCWLGSSIKDYPVAMTKEAARALAYYSDVLKIHRFQAYVRVENAMAIRWAESFGFKAEGTLQKFGADGGDYHVMGRLT